jgi:hypothetical protein
VPGANGSPGLAIYVPAIVALVFQVVGVYVSAYLVKGSRSRFADMKIDDAARAGALTELVKFSFFSQVYLVFVPVVVALLAITATVAGAGRELAIIGAVTGGGAVLIAAALGRAGETVFGEINSSAPDELKRYERLVVRLRMTRLSDAVVWLLIALTFVYQLITAYVSSG